MKFMLSLSLFAFLSISVFGQAKDLPDVLKPDAIAKETAASLGCEVFKILPRGMFQGPFNAYKDEENPLGIREGGAYYSFATRSHSYNKNPQLGYQDGNLLTGFAGLDYGLLKDLGTIELAALTNESPELAAERSYTPPKLISEIRLEQGKSHEYHTLKPATVGHTYALRAFNFGESDNLVVFNILSKGQDGSLTIIWKPIAEFPKPVAIEQPDIELKAKARAILDNNGFSNISLEVEDNILILGGTASVKMRNDLYQLLRPLGPRGYRESFNK